MKIVEPSVTLEWVTPNAAQTIEQAGRTCYKSEDKITPDSAKAFIHMLIHERKHESVIEHASASMRVVCDRGVSHEWVRHRLASYSQESTRYCNYSKSKFRGEITVIQPPGLNAETYAVWRDACLDTETAYLALLANNVSPQIARSVLPTCLKTEFVCTMNFREWRHFLKQRTAPAAHPQMCEAASMARDILVYVCPEVFRDFAAVKDI